MERRERERASLGRFAVRIMENEGAAVVEGRGSERADARTILRARRETARRCSQRACTGCRSRIAEEEFDDLTRAQGHVDAVERDGRRTVAVEADFARCDQIVLFVLDLDQPASLADDA